MFRIIVSGEKWAGVAYDLFERAKSNDETIAELRSKLFDAGVAKETLFFAEMNNPKQLHREEIENNIHYISNEN